MIDVSANELDLKVVNYMRHFDVYPILPHLQMVGAGQLREVLDDNPEQGPNRYYQWLSCLMRVLEPKQVIELGPAAGISTIMMATQLDKDAKLYSVDIDKDLAWKWMKYDYPQVTKILGDDLNMNIWDGINLMKTDVWFIDTLHKREQLEKEIELYKPFWKKGAVVVFDDIRDPELWPVWESLPYDKCETTHPNHYSGFGHIVI